MRTKATIKGHPIHQILIAFPVGFLIGAFVFDALGLLLGTATLWTTGGHLAIAGVVMGIVAAIPGFIDYLFAVPPNSSGKKRATRHMLVMLTTVTLFFVAWLVRGVPEARPGAATLVLEIIGLATLGSGAWMGGTMVLRNFIGPDHRYAGAGKWKETSVEPGESIRAARADELRTDQMKLLRVGDRRIVLGRTETGYVAFDDACTHRGGSLADGVMICGTVQCLWHGSQFDVHSGEVKAGPATEPIKHYRVEEKGDDVYIVLTS